MVDREKVKKIKNKIDKKLEEEVRQSLMNVFGNNVLTEDEWDEINENGIDYVLKLYKSHKNRKKELGHRVQVLRVLVRRLHDAKRLKMSEFEFNVRCEKYLDNLLFKFGYRLESAIDYLREIRST